MGGDRSNERCNEVSAKPETPETGHPTIRLIDVHAASGDTAPYEVTRPLTLIGSGAGSDIMLSPGVVDEAHAVFVRLGSGVFVCDLGAPGGTRVNGSFVRWSRLDDGDALAIGPYEFAVEIESISETIVTSVRRFSLREDQTIGTVGSEDPVLLIGSDAACDIVLGDGTIAPRHALVVWTCEGPMVRDLRGRRSVRVRGRWVNESRLVAGETIGVGTHDLIFETEASAAGEPYGGTSRTATGWRVTDDASDAERMVAGRVPANGEGLHDEESARADDVGELDEEAASRELIREMERMGCADGAANDETWESQSAERLDDSDVLELLEEVEEIDERSAASAANWGNAGGRAGAGTSRKESYVKGDHSRESDGNGSRSTESLRAQRLIDESRGALDSVAPDFRQRVVAAQQALDERARKLREELDAERNRLRSCQEQLQAQARRLLEAARATRSHTEETSAEDVEDPIARVRAVMESATGSSRDKRRGDAGLPIDADGASLQEQVNELARLVREERLEMQESESRLETQKFEIERQAEELARSREKHQVQQAEHEARYQTLTRAKLTLSKEREALVSRLRRLESKAAAIETRINEAERIKQDLAMEAERLARIGDLHDERVRELRIGLEGERHRLRIRQAELQRKASELARLASARRKAIEELITEQQTNLKAEETALQSRRSALVEAGRAELERTATELEQVLSVRLSDVEAELLTRQETLDSWIRAIHDTARPLSGGGRRTDRGFAFSARSFTGKDSTYRAEGLTKPVSDVRHLAQLERELEGLHRAVVQLEQEPSPWERPTETKSDFGEVSGPSVSRSMRWSNTGRQLTSKLSDQFSSLREGLEEISRSVSAGIRTSGSTETGQEAYARDPD